MHSTKLFLLAHIALCSFIFSAHAEEPGNRFALSAEQFEAIAAKAEALKASLMFANQAAGVSSEAPGELSRHSIAEPCLATAEGYDPLLVVVLMVKNEQDVIVPTLKPFVDGGVDAFFIFDTGSTDRTVEVVTEYLQASNVRFKIGQEPFIDFAASRNRGLDLAQEAFPNSAFMVMPDAEWYIINAHDLLKFCKENKDGFEPSYSIRIASSDIDFYTPRLIRTKFPIRFVGKVHEVLNHSAREMVPAHVVFDLRPSQYGADKSRKRWERDVEILLRGYIENPLDTRNLFYLAQTYWCLDNLPAAYQFYKIRAPLPGWDEEDFLSWYRLARITEQLSKTDSSQLAPGQGKCTWAEAMEYYLKAFAMRPCRAEPLVRIAQHYLDEDNHAVGYVFALRASQVPYPNDILMVEKDLYEYQRHEILCRCAWYIGEFEVGFTAACKAKQKQPELHHVQRNAQLFFDKMCEKDFRFAAA